MAAITPPIPDKLYEIKCPKVGKLNVYVQGNISTGECSILTVHDLGCNHYHYEEFLQKPKLQPLAQRCTWIHIEIPGQGDGDEDLPPAYNFPTIGDIASDLVHVLDHLKVKQVVVFGEGAGANILARFAIEYDDRVLGAVLIHCTGSTAGFLESLKDKMGGLKISGSGLTPSVESYLVLHRFGSIKDAENEMELKHLIKTFKDNLQSSVNPKNLDKFIKAFINRTNLSDKISNLKCPVLFITGTLASHHKSVYQLYDTLLKANKSNPTQRSKIELIQIECSNVLTEKPDKVAESLQYFLQGLGTVGHLPMQSGPIKLNRRMSMEDYDKPRGRASIGSGSPPNHCALNEVDSEN